MTDWAKLEDAYGSAERIPELLADAVRSGNEFGDEWNELWGRLCHQGTVYSASYASLPLLTEAAVQREPAAYNASLQLAAAIVASNDGAVTSEPVRQLYAAEIGRLRGLTLRGLDLAADDTDFIYGLEALMAFEDGGVWQRFLNHLADGELPLECPSCQEALLINLDAEVPSADVWDRTKAPTEVMPLGAQPGTAEARLLDLASSYGHTDVATKLRFLFGKITCPECGAAFASSAGLRH